MSKSILAYIVTSSSSFKNIGRKLYANQRKMQQLHCCAPQKFKPVTHVIFDLDGTILDTEGIYMSAIAEIGAEYGKKFTDALRNQVAGSKEQDTASIVVREMGLPMSWEEFLKAFRAKCDSQLPDAEFLPGVVKMIKHLHSHNIPIAVATSSPQDAVDLKSTNKKNIFDLFSHIVCGSSDPEVKQGKPAPDIFLICASRFPDKPDPSKCLVFEDAINGVQGALKAGMQVVMIPDKSVSYEFWKDATLRLDSMESMVPEFFGLPPFDKNNSDASFDSTNVTKMNTTEE
ncbi:pseudouridine-5'-phosphatase [Leptinotarsa decemlineata]|uniref:pseudouridine-5'-phosphatase n=1 Tax=Leptinotarsa decemlineata TaxID=7539 RepID=UPI000C2536BE|nr:pseudouridine-5'-phosphatase-like [Leptinotarsa decemlineata]